MNQAVFKSYSVQQLGEYLLENGFSSEAIETLKDNRVSGLALLLPTESELATLLPMIGDKAIVGAILRTVKVSWTGISHRIMN